MLLAQPVDTLKAHYDVVVIGSGYGGGIAASRLSRAGLKVCVLERGREHRAGDFPTNSAQVAAETQVQFDGTLPAISHIGRPSGLYLYHLGHRMNAVVGCGLGGTSLINANVALVPDPRIFDDPRWPQALRRGPDGALPAQLQAGFAHAEAMLAPSLYPDHLPTPHKFKALEKAAALLGEESHKVPITVAFQDQINAAGVVEKACNRCGDCVSGCNFESKRTVNRSYLPDARNHGAEIFTEINVHHIEKRAQQWVIHFNPTERGWDCVADAPHRFITADTVVLSAGSIGTPEILLRSKSLGLPLSEKVGHFFSSNQNVLGFGFNTKEDVHAVGLAAPTAEVVERIPEDHRPGPCIVGAIDMRNRANVADGRIIEEGVAPGPLATEFKNILLLESTLIAKPPKRNLIETVAALGRDLQSATAGAHAGAIDHTLSMLLMGHDQSQGTIKYDPLHDRAFIDWPEGDDTVIASANQNFLDVAHALGGDFIKNPLWSKLTHHTRITVQPLGGCVMADSAEQGGVNSKGQVFAGPTGTEVHAGLYVMDGSVLPVSTGLNPFLTISAISERTCMLFAEDHGLSLAY